MRVLITIIVLSLVTSMSLQQVKSSLKVDQLRKRALSSDDYIIKFDYKDYKYYIETAPRPYDIVILFATKKSETCDQVYIEYQTVASHFKEKKSHFTSKEGGKLKRPVFFATVYHSSDTAKIFRDLDFRGVPNLLVSKPRELTFLDPIEKRMYQRYFLWEIQKSDGLITAKKLMPWVNQKTDRHIPYVESIWTFLHALAYLLAILAVALTLYTQMKEVVLNPILWFCLAMMVIFVAYAGIVFDILNDVPWSGRDRDGNEIFIAQSSRSQYVSEGLLMSGSIITTGLLFVAFTLVPKYINNWMMQRICSMVILWGIWSLLISVEGVFGSKNAYHPNLYPPEHYKRGPLRVDQGSFL